MDVWYFFETCQISDISVGGHLENFEKQQNLDNLVHDL